MARPWGLESSCAAVKILDLLGALEEVPHDAREAFGRFVLSLQDPVSGLIVDPLVSESDKVGTHFTWDRIWDHATGVALQALPLLGASVTAVPKLAGEPETPAEVAAWLDSLPWRENAWRAGSIIGGFMARHRARCGLLESSVEDDLSRAVMDQLEARQDPATGLWGPDRGCPLYQAAAGLHCMSCGTYYLPCRPLPRPERIIDSVLALQQADGNFGTGGACLNYDSVKDLASAARYTEHRRPEAVAAVGRLADRALRVYRKPDGGFSFYETHCLERHNSIRVADARPESDVGGTHMYLIVVREHLNLVHALGCAPVF